MKKLFGIILVVAVAMAILPAGSNAAPLKKLSWRAEYYNNASLSGPPTMAVFESSFGHNWGYGSPSPEIPVNRFSARFTRQLHFEKGTYFLLMNVDDGVRVWLDGKPILDAWSIGAKSQIRVKFRIENEDHYEVQVAYFEDVGPASVNLEFIKVAGQNEDGVDDILGAWKGAYYSNRYLEGTPVMVRQDATTINFDWNSGSPDPLVPRDNFSVRWTRSLFFAGGHYTFRVQHDDGMRVYIDDKIIYDSWFDQEVSYEVGIVPINAGYRRLTVEYYDHVGNAVVHFSIDGDPGDYDDTLPDPNEPAVYVDNTSNRFYWFGPDPYSENYGFGGNHFWTYNAGNHPENYGKWVPELLEPGNYEVMAYVPEGQSTTKNAVYQIQHFGRVATRSLDQSRYGKEFVSLGIYYFDAKGNEFVVLRNNTGEPPGSTQIAFDALKFVKR